MNLADFIQHTEGKFHGLHEEASRKKVNLLPCKVILNYIIYILTEVTLLGGSQIITCIRICKYCNSTIQEIVDSAKC